MSLPRVSEIPRAFAEWGTEQVVQWLGTLQLSRDYTKQFRGDGAALAIIMLRRVVAYLH